MSLPSSLLSLLYLCAILLLQATVIQSFLHRNVPLQTEWKQTIIEQSGSILRATNNDKDDIIDDGFLRSGRDKLEGINDRAIVDFSDIPPPPPQFQPPTQPPNKGDLYSNDELMNLFQIHQSIESERKQQPSPKVEEFSLHDLVLSTIQNVEEKDEKPLTESDENDAAMQEEKDAFKTIRAIATDVDGTLLTSPPQSLHPRTEAALRLAVEKVQASSGDLFFFPATGKSRQGCLSSFDDEIRGILEQLPGVFVQGLHCVDSDGNVVFEKKLVPEAVVAAEQLAAKYNVTVIGFDGDTLLANQNANDEQIAEIARFQEPMPQIIPQISQHENGVNKLLLMDFDTDKLKDVVRPPLEKLASTNEATVTQAMPAMLELLPAGCSKARGVAEMCKLMGIDPSRELLAIGDAENDAEMLAMAAVGVAVGNACPVAKEVANHVLQDTNDEGGAGAAMEQFGFL